MAGPKGAATIHTDGWKADDEFWCWMDLNVIERIIMKMNSPRVSSPPTISNPFGALPKRDRPNSTASQRGVTAMNNPYSLLLMETHKTR